MDQFRQVGEVVGSLKALMVLKHEITINQRQCCLLNDMMQSAFDTISEEMRQKLKLDEQYTKWKALELPLKELHRVLKDAECYIRYCMDSRNWWGKAISLHMNRDCMELHVHNLLSCFTIVIEAIETTAEISGTHTNDMHKKMKSLLLHKYDKECEDPNIFLWKFGKQFLVPREVCIRLETAWAEDRWMLLEKVGEKKAKNEQKQVAELLTSKKVMSSNILNCQVKRRLGSGYPNGPGHLKEIHWLGESFALRTFTGDVGPLLPEISSLLSHSHPNTLQHHCAFYDEVNKEGHLIMELMSKDLGSYVKEHSGQRYTTPFSVPVALDIMLQIARGMEYLHSKKIYHGDLNPSNILLKPKNRGFQAKVSGYGMTAIKSCATRKPKPAAAIDHVDIWLAPEVLAEFERSNNVINKTEKGDVYSFGMICFQLLTGKVPFEDGHLQGEEMVRNIRAGERPLFSYLSPKYLANLTKKCWQTNPTLRPSFSSICRILRYIKKILVINPAHAEPDSAPPLVDYCDMEACYLKKFPEEVSGGAVAVTQIPFQMVAYKLLEKERTNNKKRDLVKPPTSTFNQEQMDDQLLVPTDQRSISLDIIDDDDNNNNNNNTATDVDMRTVTSETIHPKHNHLDHSLVRNLPRKGYSIATASSETSERKATAAEFLSAHKLPSSASIDWVKRLPQIPEKKNSQETMNNNSHRRSTNLKNTKTKVSPESEKLELPMSSPGRAKKTNPATASPSESFRKTVMQSSSPVASPSRYFNKFGYCASPKRDTSKSTRSAMNSPAREFKTNNGSSMYSPRRKNKEATSHSQAASPSRVYNVCDAYTSPISSPMNPNLRHSRLGRQNSMSSIDYQM